MPDSNVVKPKNNHTYYRELIEYLEPFAEVGSRFFKNYDYSIRKRQSIDARRKLVGNALSPIKSLIQKIRQSAASELTNADLKSRTVATLGYFEFIEEHLGIQAQNQLNKKLVEMRDLKDELLEIIEDKRVEGDLRMTYLSLLITLVTARLAAFECLDSDLDDIDVLAREEIDELLAFSKEAARIMRALAAKRFEFHSKLIRESGLTGTEFFVRIDGELKWLDVFTSTSPRPPISVVRQRVRNTIEDYREEAGTQALIQYRQAWLEYQRSRDELRR